MNDPYKTPGSSLKKEPRRVFSTPLVVPLSTLGVIGIYAGYAYFFFRGEDTGLLAFLKDISFEVFLASQIGMMLLAVRAKSQLDRFLMICPVISDQNSLEKLKFVARSNMWTALVQMFLLGLGSLTAIMSILNFGGYLSIVVVVMALITAKVFKLYSQSEENVKQIECIDSSLEDELNEVFHCWLNKPFPNF